MASTWLITPMAPAGIQRVERIQRGVQRFRYQAYRSLLSNKESMRVLWLTNLITRQRRWPVKLSPPFR